MNDSTEISYDNFIVQIASGKIYKDKSFSTTLEFLTNLIKGIIHHVDLTLVDPLIQGYDPSEAAIDVENLGKLDFNSMVDAIVNSTSKITIFTSGTTGQPKKVTHSLSNLIREVRTSTRHRGAIWGYAYNPTHMAGLQVLFQALLNGNTLVDLFGKSKSSVISMLENHTVTHLSATPTFYRLLLPLNRPNTSLKSVSLGGEKSDTLLIENLKTSFPNAKINNIYASTEAGTLFSADGEYFYVKSHLLEKVRFRKSELEIHASLLGSGMADQEWYATGDLVEWKDDDKKYFKFVSRKNEMVNVGGNKVNPHDIETQLKSIERVIDCLVYGVPNPILGNMICADIVVKDSSIDEFTIKKILRNNLENYQIPRKINIVDELKTTRTGKLKRK
ncbi:hypothetical protein BST86_07300 [Nonlabens agnitus]|uniref:AMP-binding protein n=1 Tax=Nonlabens agnitus TaxID=870484 RepID=A0A2S9WY55_9FLAO|nr:hypothetical protein BST86_07300 [Nonlabens agnitus]